MEIVRMGSSAGGGSGVRRTASSWRGASGRSDASATCRLVNPWTRPKLSVPVRVRSGWRGAVGLLCAFYIFAALVVLILLVLPVLLAGLAPRILYPAHGDPVTEPLPRLAELGNHRRHRTAQILSALDEAGGTAADLAARIYAVPQHLMPAAERNVLAHLLALADLGAVTCDGRPGAGARWRRAAAAEG